jgi:hypothetical protein
VNALFKKRDLVCGVLGAAVTAAVLLPIGFSRVRDESIRAEEAQERSAAFARQAEAESTKAAEEALKASDTVRRMIENAKMAVDEGTGTAQEKITAVDSAVLSAALQHLGTQKNTPSFTGRDDKKAILVHTQSLGPSELYLSDSQIHSDTIGEKWNVEAELREGLRRRNLCTVSLDKLAFEKEVLPADLDKALASYDWRPPEKYPDARAYVRVWLPAYSKDGQTAVVRLMVGPTPHGATATYLLTRGKSGWTVTKWKIAFYV